MAGSNRGRYRPRRPRQWARRCAASNEPPIVVPNEPTLIRPYCPGVVGVKSGGAVIRMFPGALQAFQRIVSGDHPSADPPIQTVSKNGSVLPVERQTTPYDLLSGEYGSTMRIAAASSADTPQAVRIGRAAMDLLEVQPGGIRGIL